MSKPPTKPTMPPSKPSSAPKPEAPPPARVRFGAIPESAGQRVVVYGPGGIGKTTLGLMAPGPVAVFDLDESLPALRGQLPDGLDVRVVEVPASWDSVRAALHAPGWEGIGTILIDSATRAEELCTDWVLLNVPHEKGYPIKRLEDYGFGKQFSHIFETFIKLLGDLDAHVRAGRNVVLVCHDCTASVPNPMGEDFIRYEPRLQSPPSGKNSVRLRVREWADHVLFVGYDVDAKDGKGRGSGTRTIYPCELPSHMAKSRSLREPLFYELHSAALWEALAGIEGA